MSKPCSHCEEAVTLIEDGMCALCLEFLDTQILHDLQFGLAD